MIKLVVSGPESSGKTTLASELSKLYNTNLVQEFAREYLTNIKNHYCYNDLLKIAKKQYHLEQISTNKKICICDTDLITIKVWSEFKFKKCDQWIKNKIKSQKQQQRIYLLCKPDLNWEYDPQRENQFNRDELFEIYLNELKKTRHEYHIIDGNNRLINEIDKEINVLSEMRIQGAKNSLDLSSVNIISGKEDKTISNQIISLVQLKEDATTNISLLKPLFFVQDFAKTNKTERDIMLWSLLGGFISYLFSLIISFIKELN